jgi:hypothetical protein
MLTAQFNGRADAQIIKALVIRGANRHVPAPCMWDSMASSPPRSHSTWRLFACAAVCAWLTPLGQAPKTPVEMASELHPRIAKGIRKALHSEDTDAVFHTPRFPLVSPVLLAR